MSPGTRPVPLPESILVVRLGAMGDVIHTLAAATALRARLPGLRIGWVVEARWRELLCARNSPPSGPRGPGRPVVDFVHIADTKRWRKSLLLSRTRREIQAAWREIRSQNYELAADFQGALKSAFLARSAGAKAVSGFENPRETPARLLYTERFQSQGVHVVDHYHSLAEALVARPLPGLKPLFPCDPEADTLAAGQFAGKGDALVLISPGAGWGAKQWPADRYGTVARALAARGMRPIIHFGPGERELAQRVQRASGGRAHPFACSISELIALTRRAKLFIGGDTGPLHLAAALKIPVVAIFGPTDPARNGPYGTASIVLRNSASKTSLSHTSAPDPGLLTISAEEVISAAGKLLEDSGA
ncbi:MAG: glycosyltransferase family 9 protein [Acidobacteria bacterium]|nr:glycosyltransferase family 9 protein [Acidobacteriota bacterium]